MYKQWRTVVFGVMMNAVLLQTSVSGQIQPGVSAIWMKPEQAREYLSFDQNAQADLFDWMNARGAKAGDPDVKGDYVHYRHADLSIWFGPYSDLQRASADLRSLRALTDRLRLANPERYGNARAILVRAEKDDSIKNLREDDPNALEMGYLLESLEQLEVVNLVEREFERGRVPEARAQALGRSIREIELSRAGATPEQIASSIWSGERTVTADKLRAVKEAVAVSLAGTVDDPSAFADALNKPLSPTTTVRLAAAIAESLKRSGLDAAQADAVVEGLKALGDEGEEVSPSLVRTELRKAADLYLRSLAQAAQVDPGELATESMRAETVQKLANAAQVRRGGAGAAGIMSQAARNAPAPMVSSIPATDFEMLAQLTSPAEPPALVPLSLSDPRFQSSTFRTAVEASGLDLQTAMSSGLNQAAARDLMNSIAESYAQPLMQQAAAMARTGPVTFRQQGFTGEQFASFSSYLAKFSLSPKAAGMTEAEVREATQQGMSGERAAKLVRDLAEAQAVKDAAQAIRKSMESAARLPEGAVSEAATAEQIERVEAAIREQGQEPSSHGVKDGVTVQALKEAMAQSAQSAAESIARPASDDSTNGTAGASATSHDGQRTGGRTSSETSSDAGQRQASGQPSGPRGDTVSSAIATSAGRRGLSGDQVAELARAAAQRTSSSSSQAASSAATGGSGTAAAAPTGGAQPSDSVEGSSGKPEDKTGSDVYQIRGFPSARNRPSPVRQRPPTPARSVTDQSQDEMVDRLADSMNAGEQTGSLPPSLLVRANSQQAARVRQDVDTVKRAVNDPGWARGSASPSSYQRVASALNSIRGVVGSAATTSELQASERSDASMYSAEGIQRVARKTGIDPEQLRQHMQVPRGFDPHKAREAALRYATYQSSLQLEAEGAPWPIVASALSGDVEQLQTFGRASGRVLMRRQLEARGVDAGVVQHLYDRDADKIAASLEALTPEQIQDLQNTGVLTPSLSASITNKSTREALKDPATIDAMLMALAADAGIPSGAAQPSAEDLRTGRWLVDRHEGTVASALGLTQDEYAQAVSAMPSQDALRRMVFSLGSGVGWDVTGQSLGVDPAEVQIFGQSPAQPFRSRPPSTQPSATPPTLDALRQRLRLLRAQIELELTEYEASMLAQQKNDRRQGP